MNDAMQHTTSVDPVVMSSVYCDTLIDLAANDERIVVLDADLLRANGMLPFAERYPDRVFDVGVAEANMIGVAAGLSAVGLIPFPATFACFATRRVFDQFFVSAAYAQQNVKLTGTDPGITALFNGGTHMPFDDIGLMRGIPGLLVCEPSCPISLRKLLPQIAYRKGSSYLRLQRRPAAVPIYDETEEFELGRGKVVRDGADLTIITCGALMLHEALKAAEALSGAGISAALIDMYTAKPIDEDLIVRYAVKTGAILTAENHQVRNGLGSAVAEVVTDNQLVPMTRVGVKDEFGEVGTLDYLQQRYKLTADEIVTQAKALVARK